MEILNIALSGIRASEKKLEITANNVVNSQTDHFRKSRAVLQEEIPSGVKVVISKPNGEQDRFTPERNRTDANAESHVCLEEEIANLITTSTMYESNLKVIETEKEMKGELLDIKT